MNLCMTGEAEELRKANESVRECARPCGCSLAHCVLGSSSVLKLSALTLGDSLFLFHTHPHPCAASGVSVIDAIGA